jgi:hypothetical protein
MKVFLIILSMGYVLLSSPVGRRKEIIQFVESELSHYSEAQLTDIYKNYFQDAFGPGHLIPDTTQAGSYLDWELKQSDWKDTTLYQALGTNHDFYRINLALIKKGIIPRDTLLNGIVKSAAMARNPSLENWRKEWNEVFLVIKEVKPELRDIQSDEKIIAETLEKGEVVMHHSEHYAKTYHPHYRIIHHTIFERWKRSFLKDV